MRLFWLSLGILADLAVILVSVVPGELRPHTGSGGGTEHFAAYLFVAFALGVPCKSYRAMYFTALFLTLQAGALEITQFYVPGREPGWAELVTGSLGALLGAASGKALQSRFLAIPRL